MQLRVPASRQSTIGVIIDITSMPVPQMAHHVSITVFVLVGRILLISFLTVFIFNIYCPKPDEKGPLS